MEKLLPRHAQVSSGPDNYVALERVNHALKAADRRVSLASLADSWVLRGVSMQDFVDEIVGILGGDAFYYSVRSDSCFVRMGEDTLVSIEPSYFQQRTYEKLPYAVMPVLAQGPRGVVENLFRELDKRFKLYRTDPQASAKWLYLTQQGLRSSHVVINKPPIPLQECYPWLPGIDTFFDEYMKTEASILFFAGPPGTGKTSLLRYFMHQHKLKCTITYDEELFQTDTPFIEFLTTSDERVLIIEDADVLLSSRESAGNKVISRFLNVSDGLLRFPSKKIVFTTNLSDFSKVDQALLRPGRCFGSVHARHLTHDEAVVACRAMGRDMPEEKKREYTLAELYNSHGGVPVAKFGFAA